MGNKVQRTECRYCYASDAKCLKIAVRTGHNCCPRCNGHDLKEKK